ncbi:unnamed protein product [Prunus armeniaca]|uniref:Uncharacterized protein n=1 Tax=Prunus armeniaca TaxID=36596 RepID=A0A6J5UWX3_PRUAR|nr:unnamed protein product [Prunus armeniaca]
MVLCFMYWGSWDLDLLLHGLVVGKIIEDFELFFKVVGASSSIEYGFFFDLMGFFFSSAGGAGGLSKSGVGADAGDLCLVGVAADGEVVGVCFLKWVGFNFVWLNLYEAEQVGAFALKLMKSTRRRRSSSGSMRSLNYAQGPLDDGEELKTHEKFCEPSLVLEFVKWLIWENKRKSHQASA